MAQNTSEALVAVTGSINSFATTEALAYGAFAALPATTKEHGFASDAGVTLTGSRSITNKVAWQNATVVRGLVTESGLQISFTLIQSNDTNKELYFGSAKNVTTGGFHWNLANTGGIRSFVIDVIDEARGKKIRYWIPEAEVTEVSEIQLASSEFIGYGITLTAYATEIAGEVANLIEWEDDLANEPATV